GMVLMGIGYSVLACALWPMVALIIPEHQLGTAYGVMQSVQNLGLACIVLLAGYIVDEKGYIVLEIFFLCWLCYMRKRCNRLLTRLENWSHLKHRFLMNQRYIIFSK
ncbi:unnamed protein product, partial [Medioppia subpectinata]